MATILSIILAICIALLLLPTVSDLVSIAFIALKGPRRRVESTTGNPSFLILVPAHNEELLIQETIRSVQRVRWPKELVKLVVIADNCSDNTAGIARSNHAVVLERTNPVQRGKPYAIAWALDQLEVAQFDAVVILDADSKIDEAFCEAIASTGGVRARAFQGWIDLSNPTESAITRMASIFSAARCLFMNEIKTRSGLTVPFGNGLCLGSEVILRHGWTAFSICEDWELYAIMTQKGIPVIGVPAARTYSQEARSVDQSSSQRSRWAAGKMAVLLGYMRGILKSRTVSLRQKIDTLAELTALGPVVHAAFAILLAVILILIKPPAWFILTILSIASLLRIAIYSALATRHTPEPLKAIVSFLYLPFYAIWRIGVQIKSFGLVGDNRWIRTARHDETASRKKH